MKPSHQIHQQNFIASRIFTDRDQPRQQFRTALAQTAAVDHYQLLNFYGVGGQGKSALCNEFLRMMRQESDHPPLGWADLNFENSSLRQTDQALFTIRLKLRDSTGIAFPTFDFAFARYQRLAYPGSNIREKYPELFRSGNEILEDITNVAGDIIAEIPGLSLFYK